MSETKQHQILGILNITEDSFSDGGRYLAPAAALAQARKLIADGADTLDIGPASSHPDAKPVSAAEEIARLKPVLGTLIAEGVSVSVDSFRPETQMFAIEAGAAFLNDIHGFPDRAIQERLAGGACRLIVMHAIQAQGIATREASEPATIWDRILRFFDARLSEFGRAGIASDRVVLDPGMGFFLGNQPAPSLAVLADLGRLKRAFGLPVLVSVSRKSFVHQLAGSSAAASGAASLAAELWAAREGADYIRTHDARALKQALTIKAALVAARPAGQD
jgi:dihydropteroate synthase type 2